MSKHIVGLDFGQGVIRAAEVTPGGHRRPVVHRYHEVEIPADAVREGVVADQEAVVSALKWLWSVGSFSTKRVVIGMGSQQVLIRELVLPAMPLKHVRETLPFRVQDMLPLPAEEAVLDFYPVEEFEDGEERQLRGLLVAATRESVLTNIRALRAAGLTPVDVDLVPFAITRTQLLADWGGTKVLAHIGAASTSVIVVERGIPQFVRMLPTGGADLTEALAERLGVRRERAEELKRRIGLNGPADAAPESTTVTTMGRDSAREFVQAVRATTAFFQNAHPDSVVDGVVLSGGGASMHGLADFVAQSTGLPVLTANPTDGFSFGSHVDEAGLLAAGSAPTVALGLTLRSA